MENLKLCASSSSCVDSSLEYFAFEFTILQLSHIHYTIYTSSITIGFARFRSIPESIDVPLRTEDDLLFFYLTLSAC